MKRLTLSIKDRIILIGIIQTMEFDRLGATTLNSILSAISFDDDERASIQMQNTANGLIWDAQKGVDRDFELTAEQVLMLKKSMNVLDERKKLMTAHLPLDTKITQL